MQYHTHGATLAALGSGLAVRGQAPCLVLISQACDHRNNGGGKGASSIATYTAPGALAARVTLPTKPVVRPVAQQPTFDQNSQLPASQPVGAATVCSYLFAMGTSQLPASCQPVRGPNHLCQPVASQFEGLSICASQLPASCCPRALGAQGQL